MMEPEIHSCTCGAQFEVFPTDLHKVSNYGDALFTIYPMTADQTGEKLYEDDLCPTCGRPLEFMLFPF